MRTHRYKFYYKSNFDEFYKQFKEDCDKGWTPMGPIGISVLPDGALVHHVTLQIPIDLAPEKG